MGQNEQPQSEPVPPSSSHPVPLDYASPRPPVANRVISSGLGIVVIVIVTIAVVLIVGILIPAITVTRRSPSRQKCASHLRQIGQALQLYANDNKCYPRTYYDPSVATSFAANFTGGAKTSPSSNPFLPQPLGSVGTNNVLAAMFLLVKTTDLNQEVFVCPISNQEKDTFTSNGTTLTSKNVSNFTGPDNVSYSFANPYQSTNAVRLGYKWSPNVTADFAIAADRNDGFTAPADAANVAGLMSNSPQAQQRQANSRNHERDGQNVLYNDGHVEWSQTSFCGANRDNIYTAARTVVISGQPQQSSPDAASKDTVTTDPQLDLDTILLPKF